MEQALPSSLVELTTDIAAAYVASNSLAPAEVPALIRVVYECLSRLGNGAAEAPVGKPSPAVPVKKSITPDFLISLEDGRQYKSLKRHLRTAYGMSPEEYRAKWSLPKDYPMVAPNYAAARSAFAKAAGLGNSRRAVAKAPVRGKAKARAKA
jgi:predicted transcriptional regulator